MLNTLRWKKFPVLDNGFVCLVDVMGDDEAIVHAARVSYGEGTRKVSDNRTLLRYLMRHQHTTPFEMVEIKLLVRVPMDTWRQWIRHRTASVNEYSTRYSIAIDAAYETEPTAWRKQATTNRQGSDGFIDESAGVELCAEEREFHQQARELYNSRITQGIAREQARKDLPLSTYTEAYWKTDLHNLFRFLNLRMASDAQYEIRTYAETIGYSIVKPLFPMAWEAFVDYQFESLRLSKLDREMITRITAAGKVPVDEGEFLAMQLEVWQTLERSRERDECLAKLRGLGLVK